MRVTGLDVELIREVGDALTAYCGGQKPIVPTLHLTRYRDLFIEMNEGHLDLFVASVGGMFRVQDLRACGIQSRIFITAVSGP